METYGVALFYSTREAMKAEEIVKKAQLAVRIIPTPEKIHASCGFSLKYPLAEEEKLTTLLAEAGIASEGFYQAQQTGLKTEYQLSAAASAAYQTLLAEKKQKG